MTDVELDARITTLEENGGSNGNSNFFPSLDYLGKPKILTGSKFFFRIFQAP